MTRIEINSRNIIHIQRLPTYPTICEKRHQVMYYVGAQIYYCVSCNSMWTLKYATNRQRTNEPLDMYYLYRINEPGIKLRDIARHAYIYMRQHNKHRYIKLYGDLVGEKIWHENTNQ